MKTEIKTVYCKANYNEHFDCMVNELLKEGWKLGRVELKTTHCEDKNSMLFALLFKQEQIGGN